MDPQKDFETRLKTAFTALTKINNDIFGVYVWQTRMGFEILISVYGCKDIYYPQKFKTLEELEEFAINLSNRQSILHRKF